MKPPKFEQQSGLDRVRQAEGLILQLPSSHDGRNTWLLNYGTGPEAIAKRIERNLPFDEATRAAVLTTDNDACISGQSGVNMNTKSSPSAHDCYAKLKPDEPYFVLMGRDPNAAETVRFWAERRKIAIEDGLSTDKMEKVDEAYACADAMTLYRTRRSGDVYRQLAAEVSDAPARAHSLHGTLNDKVGHLLSISCANFFGDLRYAAAVLPRGWAVANIEVSSSAMWHAMGRRRDSVMAHGVGYTECAARTALGLQARAYDLDFPS